MVVEQEKERASLYCRFPAAAAPLSTNDHPPVMATLSFSPAPIPRGQLPQWQASGRTLSHTLSPSGTEVGAFVTKVRVGARASEPARDRLRLDGPSSNMSQADRFALTSKAISTSDRPTETKGTFQNERAIFFGQTDAVAEHLVPVRLACFAP